MKIVEVFCDFDYCADRRMGVRFLGGYTYRRVIEAAAAALVAAGAGRIILPPNNGSPDGAAGFIDAFPAFDVRRMRHGRR